MRGAILASAALACVALCAAMISAQAADSRYSLTCNDQGSGESSNYPVDIEGEFPFRRVINYARATGQSAKLEAMMRETGEKAK